jgi:hypothetical protein
MIQIVNINERILVAERVDVFLFPKDIIAKTAIKTTGKSEKMMVTTLVSQSKKE